ncbi:MAG TPA: DUF1501 domain-containing protein, partial [Burkholderiaceae bacterium]|nr:DUF1501 domain-containing protein [Burkholderiaceae bacterium]
TPLAPTTPLPGGRQVALPAQLAPLATLFDAGQCAVVANVGPLVVPTDRTSFNSRSVPLPPKLFSHNDQQSVWQASVPEGAKFGWGGRIGDLLASQNTAQIFTCNSLTGSAVFLSGQTVQPFQIDPTQGSIAFGALNANSLYGSAAGATALRSTLTRSRTHLFENDLRNVNQRSIDSNTALAAALAAAPALTTSFPANNALATQLAMVAKIISVSAELGAKRQVFMVSLGGFDTHSGQDTTHPALLTQLAGAIDAFQKAMIELNAAQKVTLFTASDFGRTLTVNGDGTDHGWGGHHFVVGGAVKGKQIVGSYPDLTANGPTDAGNGRLIPTTAVEQYAATLARWMGVTATDIPLILPNVVNFPSPDLGFMT